MIAVIYGYFVLALQIASLQPASIFILESDRRSPSREKICTYHCHVKRSFDEINHWYSFFSLFSGSTG